MPTAGRSGQGGTRTLLRGLDVLEALGAQHGDEGVRLSDLAEHVQLDKATTARLVGTLCEAGYAFQDQETKRYRLAGKVLSLASRLAEQMDLPKRATPVILRLQKAVNETVHLGVREGDHVIYIAKFETSRPIRIASGIGQRNPLHSTALGKAILAAMDPDAREAIVAELDFTLQTKRTISEPNLFLAELEKTAERGYSIDDMENEDSIVCVGAPIIGGSGEVVAAISVSGPAFRMEPQVDAVGKQCAEVAREIGLLV